jgi:hypothetical protein
MTPARATVPAVDKDLADYGDIGPFRSAVNAEISPRRTPSLESQALRECTNKHSASVESGRSTSQHARSSVWLSSSEMSEADLRCVLSVGRDGLTSALFDLKREEADRRTDS